MKKWLFPLAVTAFFALIAMLFIMPRFSGHCTGPLLNCIEQATSLPFWERIWHTLGCVYYNVICVFGGLFR